MPATINQLSANRTNARASTGPVSDAGKAITCRNAKRHGVLSTKLLVDGEDVDAFQTLTSELEATLRPVGAAESAIADRIAITIWRQRRLATAESASLKLARQSDKIAREVNLQLALHGEGALSSDDLKPFAPAQVDWCRGALEELDWLQADTTLERLPDGFPIIHAQIKKDAEDAELSIEAYLANTIDGLVGYARELKRNCQQQLVNAEARPHALAIAELARQRRLILEPAMLDVFTRYQTTLDNQLVRLLKALRETQAWRLQTLDLSSSSSEAAMDAAG